MTSRPKYHLYEVCFQPLIENIQRESQLKTCMEHEPTSLIINTIRYVAEGNIINSMGAPTVPVDLHGPIQPSFQLPVDEHLPSKNAYTKKTSGPSSNCAKGIEIGRTRSILRYLRMQTWWWLGHPSEKYESQLG